MPPFAPSSRGCGPSVPSGDVPHHARWMAGGCCDTVDTPGAPLQTRSRHGLLRWGAPHLGPGSAPRLPHCRHRHRCPRCRHTRWWWMNPCWICPLNRADEMKLTLCRLGCRRWRRPVTLAPRWWWYRGRRRFSLRRMALATRWWRSWEGPDLRCRWPWCMTTYGIISASAQMRWMCASTSLKTSSPASSMMLTGTVCSRQGLGGRCCPWCGRHGGGPPRDTQARSVSRVVALSRVPLHAQNLDLAQTVLGSSCAKVELSQFRDVPPEDDREFFVSAWRWHPNLIQEERIIFIPEPHIPGVVMDDRLPGLRYLVRVRLVAYQDWNTSPGSPDGGGPDDGAGGDDGGAGGDADNTMEDGEVEDWPTPRRDSEDNGSDDSNHNNYHPGMGHCLPAVVPPSVQIGDFSCPLGQRRKARARRSVSMAGQPKFGPGLSSWSAQEERWQDRGVTHFCGNALSLAEGAR